jgi:hypothetical protein
MHDGNTESSVLFSLDELRQLERDRLEEERQAEEDRRAAERLARLELERQARLEAERLWQEAETERAQLTQARERARLEEELRRHELEQRMAIEEKLAVEKARVEAEARAREVLRRASPWPRLVLMTSALVSVLGGGVFYYMRAATDELARQRAQAEARERRDAAQILSRQASTERQLAAELDRLRAQLKAAMAVAREPPHEREQAASEPRRHVAAPRRKIDKALPHAPVIVPESHDPLGLPE